MIIKQMIILALITFIPAFELRASIPVAILSGSVELPFHLQISGFGWPWYFAFLYCVFINMLLGPVVFFCLNTFTRYICKIGFFDKIINAVLSRAQRRVQKYVDKWGVLGVALFIGVPLPGSGSYSGALGAYVIGLKPLQFFYANILGTLIAGTLVTIVTVSGQGLFNLIFR